MTGSDWKRLLLDKRISTGAFRLMHLLLDHNNRDKGDKGCFPGLRCLARELGSNLTTISGWLVELKKVGWIDYLPQSRKRTFYRLLPEVDTVETVTGSGNSLLPKVDTDAVTGTGNITKPIELNPRTEGDKNPPSLEKMAGWQLRKDLRETTDPAEREAIRKEFQRRKSKSVTTTNKPAKPPAANSTELRKPFEPSPELAAQFLASAKAAMKP